MFYLNCTLEKSTIKKEISNVLDYPKLEKIKITKYKYQKYKLNREVILCRDDFSKSVGLKVNKDNLLIDVFPKGYITSKVLDDFIRERICLRYEELFFYHNFRGKNKNTGHSRNGDFVRFDGDPSEYEGKIYFSQIDFDDLEITLVDKIGVDPKDIEDDKWIRVNKNTGEWVYFLNSPSSKGMMACRNRKNKKIIGALNFYLIKQFKIDCSIQDISSKDLYGDEFNFSREKKEVSHSKKIPNKIFHKRSYPNYSKKDYSKEISKYLELILQTLGEEIVIVDPYLLGELENSDEKYYNTNLSQASIINAIYKTIANFKIKRIIFICSSPKVKGKIYSGDSKKNYQKMIENMKSFSSEVEIKIVEINQKIHDRYILGDNIGYSISASFTGLVGKNEVKFQSLSDNEYDVIKLLIDDYLNEQV